MSCFFLQFLFFLLLIWIMLIVVCESNDSANVNCQSLLILLFWSDLMHLVCYNLIWIQMSLIICWALIDCHNYVMWLFCLMLSLIHSSQQACILGKFLIVYILSWFWFKSLLGLKILWQNLNYDKTFWQAMYPLVFLFLGLLENQMEDYLKLRIFQQNWISSDYILCRDM